MMCCLNKTQLVVFLMIVTVLSLTGCQSLSRFGLKTSDSGNPLVAIHSSIEAYRFSLDYEQNLIGTLATVNSQAEDTLPDLARHFGLGHQEIVNANPTLDLWQPPAQTRVVLPLMFTLPDAPHKGIVLNLASMRLFYYPEDRHQQVITYPVGIGREGWETPLGRMRIISKTQNPVWVVPPSIQQEHAQKGETLPAIVASGANNPLGEYALKLSRSGYLIHGTNKPYGIGLRVSHGCLNLYPEHIRELYQVVNVGTAVRIVEQPYLLGWQQEMLFLEAHKPLQNKDFKSPLIAKIRQLAQTRKLTIDWTRVEQVLAQANGIPTPIELGSVDAQYLMTHALSVAHPTSLNYLPSIPSLTDNDWSIEVASWDNQSTAQRLTTVLNHQGPIIPARIIPRSEGVFVVVAGPFNTQEQTELVQKRLVNDFNLHTTIQPPLALRSQYLSSSINNQLPRLNAPAHFNELPSLKSNPSNDKSSWLNWLPFN
ncbi:MAG: hypothetical protein RL637_675 [Pseudomonadota bacterium]